MGVRGRLIDRYVNAVPVLHGANTNLWGRYAQAPLKGTPGIVVSKGKVEMRNVRAKGLVF